MQVKNRICHQVISNMKKSRWITETTKISDLEITSL